MLKNNKQRGTGLRLVRTAEAFSACFETTTRPGMEGMLLYRWYLAQRYITNPLLINKRKFGLRLWALVPGATPLRAYIHTHGLALFSSEPYRPEGDFDSSPLREQGSRRCMMRHPWGCQVALPACTALHGSFSPAPRINTKRPRPTLRPQNKTPPPPVPHQMAARRPPAGWRPATSQTSPRTKTGRSGI